MNNRINYLPRRSVGAVDTWRLREAEAGARSTVPAGMGETIPFREGSCALDGSARMALCDSSAVLRAHREMRVVIGGFERQRRSRACAMGLGLRRVQAIRRFLVRQGIDPDQIAVAIRGAGWCVVERPGGAADARHPRGEYRLRIAESRWSLPSD